MNTSTTPRRPAVETVAHGDPSSAATIRPANAAVFGAAAVTPYGPEGEQDHTVTVLPDVVQLPWEPYYLEPPD
jgi:hypothetical protein